MLNSTATVNYYRAYTNAFSYFAIIGEKAQTAQAAPPAVEQPKEPVKEETNAEQPKEPDAPAVEEHKAAPPYYAYFLAAVVLILAAAYVIKKYLNDDDEAPQNEQVPEPKANYSVPARVASPKKIVSGDARDTQLQNPAAKNDDLGDIEKRLDEIKKKLKE